MRLKDSLFTPDEQKLFEHTFLLRERLEEQYHDLEQQSETASFGMWVFLATEVMLFGAFFATIGAYWILYPEPVEKASEKLCWQIGGANTIVLLVSSFTMALAVHFARLGQSRTTAGCLLATAVLGCLFLVLKGVEYYIDYRDNLIPGWKFAPQEWVEKDGLSADHIGPVQIFLLMYWILTLLHALHLTIGIVAVGTLAWFARRRTYTADYYSPVEVGGLYWHFVDLVWIFLLPVLYLLGTHSL